MISKALIKYGYASFRLEILEYCNKEECLSREQYYMDLFKPEYNILLKAGSMEGYKYSYARILKMSGENSPTYGQKQSEATKEAIRQATLGDKNYFFFFSQGEKKKFTSLRQERRANP